MPKLLTYLNFGAWFLLMISGISGYRSIVNQKVPGFPNAGQMYLYLATPIAMLIFSTSLIILINKFGFKSTAGWLAFLSLVSVLPYIVISRGGV